MPKREQQEGYLAEWLSVPQLAKTLGIGLTTAYRLVNDGVIPSVRIGKYLRVKPDELAAWLDRGGGRRPPTAAPSASKAPSLQTSEVPTESVQKKGESDE